MEQVWEFPEKDGVTCSICFELANRGIGNTLYCKKCLNNIQGNNLCRKCGKHKATERWVNTYGFSIHPEFSYEKRCVCCVREAQLAYAEKLAKNIPKFQLELESLICK